MLFAGLESLNNMKFVICWFWGYMSYVRVHVSLQFLVVNVNCLGMRQESSGTASVSAFCCYRDASS